MPGSTGHKSTQKMKWTPILEYQETAIKVTYMMYDISGDMLDCASWTNNRFSSQGKSQLEMVSVNRFEVDVWMTKPNWKHELQSFKRPLQPFSSGWISISTQLPLIKTKKCLDRGPVCFYPVNSAKSRVILCYLNFPQKFEPQTKRWGWSRTLIYSCFLFVFVLSHGSGNVKD